jgi:hypothetical protein
MPWKAGQVEPLSDSVANSGAGNCREGVKPA